MALMKKIAWAFAAMGILLIFVVSDWIPTIKDLNRLRREQDSDPYKTSSIKKEVDGEKTIIRFAYMSTMPAAGNFYTKNWIAIAPDADGVYRVALESSGDRERSYMTGSFIRQLAMEWSDRPRNGR